MKHIIKVQNLENLPETSPLVAMDNNGDLKWVAKEPLCVFSLAHTGPVPESAVISVTISNGNNNYTVDRNNPEIGVPAGVYTITDITSTRTIYNRKFNIYNNWEYVSSTSVNVNSEINIEHTLPYSYEIFLDVDAL